LSYIYLVSPAEKVRYITFCAYLKACGLTEDEQSLFDTLEAQTSTHLSDEQKNFEYENYFQSLKRAINSNEQLRQRFAKQDFDSICSSLFSDVGSNLIGNALDITRIEATEIRILPQNSALLIGSSQLGDAYFLASRRLEIEGQSSDKLKKWAAIEQAGESLKNGVGVAEAKRYLDEAGESNRIISRYIVIDFMLSIVKTERVNEFVAKMISQGDFEIFRT